MQACAQRDRVIASYTLLSAIGRLDVKTLVLNTPDYLPEVHYHQGARRLARPAYAVGAVRERDAATDLKDAI
jgi:hypothetical protein